MIKNNEVLITASRIPIPLNQRTGYRKIPKTPATTRPTYRSDFTAIPSSEENHAPAPYKLEPNLAHER